MTSPSSGVIADLARTDTLRAGITLGNFLVFSGGTVNDDPVSATPDVAHEVA